MIKVNYPEPDFRTERRAGKEYIFDPIRRQWVVLTPEEWVRQNFIRFLIQQMRYPAALIAVEKEIRLGELKKRFDILVYDKTHHPWMLIECKAGSVALDEKTLHQLLRYHISVPAGFLVITNGHYVFAWEKTAGRLKELDKLPVFV